MKGGMSSASDEARRDVRGLLLAVALYVVVLVLKLAAFAATGVMAVLAEAMHTLSDLIVSGFLLLAALFSRREPDEEHMFGHERAQNVAALVAATIFLTFTSFRLYEEAIPRLLSGEGGTYQNLGLAIGVLALSMVLAAVPLAALARQRGRGPAARAQLIELVNDELGLLAALAGTVGIVLGAAWADPVATIAVATVIAVNALGLLRENAHFLLGRSPGPEYLARVADAARSVEGVCGVHSVRAEYVGPAAVSVGLHVGVPASLAMGDADRVRRAVRDRVRESTGARYCVIQLQAAGDSGAAASSAEPGAGDRASELPAP
jgi:cation diffusion facilitator family transporter